MNDLPMLPPLDWAPGTTDDCYDDAGSCAAQVFALAGVACINLLLGLGLGYLIWG